MVARRLVHLSILRFVVVLLSILILYKLYTGKFKRKGPSWATIDIEDAPPLHDPVAVILRLHEFLARPQFECDRRLVGSKMDNFFVCANNTDRGVVVTGAALTPGIFEQQMPVAQWTLIVPEYNQMHRHLNGDTAVHRLVGIQHWRNWRVSELLGPLPGHFPVAKIELYSAQLRFDRHTIDALLQVIQPHELYLIVKVTNADDADQWLSFLLAMFYQQKMALVGTTSSGICGRELRACEYRATLRRYNDDKDVLPPSFNLGSPLEERKRLLRFISDSESCPLVDVSPLPRFCESDGGNVLIVTYNKYPSWNRLHGYNVHIVSPVYDQSPLSTAQFTRSGLSLSTEKVSPDGKWSLVALPSLFQQTSFSIVVLDLEGAEWPLLDQIVQTIHDHNVQQLAMRANLYPEEAESSRRFYWTFRRFTKMGYHKHASHFTPKYFEVVFMTRHK